MNTSLSPLSRSGALVSASLSGDTAAFREIVLTHQNLVIGLCYAMLGERTAAEDAAQETFVVAWRRLATLRDPDRIRPWIAGIARNVCKNRRRAVRSDPLHAAEPSGDELDAAGGPDAQVMAREEEAIVDRLLAELPAEYREVIVLYYRENQSAADVAGALEISEDAVRQRLVRGRRLLQENMLQQVERTLRRTAPGAAFAVGVLALLPGPAASGAVLGSAVVPIGTGIATGAAAASIGAQLGWLGAAIGFICGATGGWIGARAALSRAQNISQRKAISSGVKSIGALALLYVAAMVTCTLRFRVLAALHPALPWIVLAVVTSLYLVLLVRFIQVTNSRFRAAAAPPAPSGRN